MNQFRFEFLALTLLFVHAISVRATELPEDDKDEVEDVEDDFESGTLSYDNH